ncbi:MAG TPA: DUF192 domain-containing protein [Candidatus Nitrosotalea sp.]|nr:DUF192 domain-containing protein [Candidatus Nitrosotalea sp.]
MLFSTIAIGCGFAPGKNSHVFAQPENNSASTYQNAPIFIPVPTWVKNNTGLWVHGKMTDSQFILGMRYLVANEIMPLPDKFSGMVLQKPIPAWIKTAGLWWEEGNITDQEFVSSVAYLISSGKIQVAAGGNNTLAQDSATLENNFPKGRITIDGMPLLVQVADTEERMVEGLQFQQPLPYTHGMIFVFEQPQVVAMWMKDMQFPLDMIWFDSSGSVIHIEKNLPPCTSNSPCQVYDGGGLRAKYVLEVTSGFVGKFNVTENSKMAILNLS